MHPNSSADMSHPNATPRLPTQHPHVQYHTPRSTFPTPVHTPCPSPGLHIQHQVPTSNTTPIHTPYPHHTPPICITTPMSLCHIPTCTGARKFRHFFLLFSELSLCPGAREWHCGVGATRSWVTLRVPAAPVCHHASGNPTTILSKPMTGRGLHLPMLAPHRSWVSLWYAECRLNSGFFLLWLSGAMVLPYPCRSPHPIPTDPPSHSCWFPQPFSCHSTGSERLLKFLCVVPPLELAFSMWPPWAAHCGAVASIPTHLIPHLHPH